uniref:Protein kinase domain-containing protein n=1 Tax=Rhizochromulina marina TaxID=1034831 RepID=A0A7S2RBT7_9STRA|mmetsp:Transcript_14013/g.41097  ORF Transcript_14013/g.41097 Transcript_14013/m.41097 type:complete len:565 (+) Transcript_14013:207-1901(+)|eukprot:CAMPEP_0118998980 /NCGR_PEP_ID=MMETSP1173-20130426/63347_1 /TAXON_ID=1034831 /ORGANISM="Rhizochromulina marina cf, Strain CCMP1243" /LENGTH=564 /DNA_ID=CAMNT_0006950481 /DNA_START=176 /DNA_END=1870 /DNA_ORIENTATION=+
MPQSVGEGDRVRTTFTLQRCREYPTTDPLGSRESWAWPVAAARASPLADPSALVGMAAESVKPDAEFLRSGKMTSECRGSVDGDAEASTAGGSSVGSLPPITGTGCSSSASGKSSTGVIGAPVESEKRRHRRRRRRHSRRHSEAGHQVDTLPPSSVDDGGAAHSFTVAATVGRRPSKDESGTSSSAAATSDTKYLDPHGLGYYSVDAPSLPDEHGGHSSFVSTNSPGVAEGIEDPSDLFAVVDGLGSGGYSVVVLVQQVISKKKFAMKVIPKSRLVRIRDKKRLKNELSALKHLMLCPFIQCLQCKFENPSSLFIVTEYLSGGDLFYHLHKQWERGCKGFSEEQCRTLLAEIALGLSSMHALGFVHRDVKIENIMLTREGHIKLVDLGLCHRIKDGPKVSSAGSLIYMAPELLLHGLCGPETDCWALGVLAHELLTGCCPWSSLTDREVLRLQITTLRVGPPPRVSPAAGQLICSLLRHDAEGRLGSAGGLEDIKRAPFFQHLDWAAAERMELPPAITPEEHSFDRRECRAVLRTYVAAEDDASGWSLGLAQSTKRPALIRPLN